MYIYHRFLQIIKDFHPTSKMSRILVQNITFFGPNVRRFFQNNFFVKILTPILKYEARLPKIYTSLPPLGGDFPKYLLHCPPGTYICPGIPKKSVGITWDSNVKCVGIHGITTEKNRIQNLDSGIPFPILFWDSKIYVGYQKICRILKRHMRVSLGVFQQRSL